MTSIIRFALALCAAAVLPLLPGTLRAAGDLPPDGLSAPALDNQCAPNSEIAVFNICVVKSPATFETSAALLFLQPNSGNLVYATSINPFPFLTPHWTDFAVSPDFTPAFSVGLRYNFDCGGDVQLAWTHLNTFDNASTFATTPHVPPGPPITSGPPSTQALGPSFLIGPPPPYAAASAVAHFEYDAVNLDAGLCLGAGSHVQVRTFAGLQIAHISQSLSTNFLGSDPSITFSDLSRSVFTGVGPRLGMDLHYVAGNLDLVGEMAGAALMGTRQGRMDFVTTSPQTGMVPNPQFIQAPDSTQVIPCIDAKLGASYAFPLGKCGVFKCEAGYQAAVYIDAINQFSLTQVDNTTNPATMPFEGTAAVFLRSAVEVQSNFFVHGPYLKFSFDF